MMGFTEFADKIAGELQQRLGDDYTVTVTNILKNNDVSLTGVVIRERSDSISPTVYLEEFYRQYQDDVLMEEIVEQIIRIYEKSARYSDLDMDFFRDYASVEKGIRHKVINYEKNRKLLADVPWFAWHDLAVVFYYAVEETRYDRASILIHNSHLDQWGKTAVEVYHAACRNMKENMPELLVPMQQLLHDTMGLDMGEGSLPLYVLTNRERMFGASAMLYSEKMKELADELQSDLLILPSSLHEALLLPDDRTQEYDVYRQMVRTVNETQVDPEEVLSSHLYRYSRERDRIEEIEE